MTAMGVRANHGWSSSIVMVVLGSLGGCSEAADPNSGLTASPKEFHVVAADGAHFDAPYAKAVIMQSEDGSSANATISLGGWNATSTEAWGSRAVCSGADLASGKVTLDLGEVISVTGRQATVTRS